LELYEKPPYDIRRNMEALDTPRYKVTPASQSVLPRDVAAEKQMRHLLSELISSSSDLNVRVWLDGVYTNVEDSHTNGDWMNGREIYFKVEGRVNSPRDTLPGSTGVG
jgi:hypothetical protein